jgi:hypothetical protein
VTNALVDLLSKVSRGYAEVTLVELFDILDLPKTESSLAKVILADKKTAELSLQIIPSVSQGELDSTRRIKFADSGPITAETCRHELANRENSLLELKSSLFFDHKKASRDGGLPQSAFKSEEVVHSSLKTIAAFLTTAGGTLYIGVDDAGTILGIQFDFQCMTDNLQKQNADGWELTLRGLIAGRFKDGAMVNSYVECTILELNQLPIARIKVAPRRQLSFVKQKGSESYLLYRRQGNQTTVVGIDEVEEFLDFRRSLFE